MYCCCMCRAWPVCHKIGYGWGCATMHAACEAGACTGGVAAGVVILALLAGLIALLIQRHNRHRRVSALVSGLDACQHTPGLQPMGTPAAIHMHLRQAANL